MMDNCNPATCPNGKCNQTGECIEQVAQEMRTLGSHFKTGSEADRIEKVAAEYRNKSRDYSKMADSLQAQAAKIRYSSKA